MKVTFGLRTFTIEYSFRRCRNEIHTHGRWLNIYNSFDASINLLL